MPLDDALDYAQAGAEPGPTGETGHASKASTLLVGRVARGDSLTSREREVAALVARGMTSRQIAAALVISERTAEAHVDHIRDKLGVRTRAEIAAWAVRSGIVAPRPDGEPPRGT